MAWRLTTPPLHLKITRGTISWFSPLPYHPLSSCQIFKPLISALTGFHDCGLVTRWAQLLITSNYYLPSAPKVFSHPHASAKMQVPKVPFSIASEIRTWDGCSQTLKILVNLTFLGFLMQKFYPVLFSFHG